jgi:hypothetical protein
MDKHNRHRDYSGATNIQMRCSDNSTQDGDGNSNGEWQQWKYCNPGHGILGLQAQFDMAYQNHDHETQFKIPDESGLANLNFACGLPYNTLKSSLPRF